MRYKIWAVRGDREVEVLHVFCCFDRGRDPALVVCVVAELEFDLADDRTELVLGRGSMLDFVAQGHMAKRLLRDCRERDPDRKVECCRMLFAEE